MEVDEEVTLLRKALDAGDIPNDFDPNKIPQTGEEYLHYVMYEKMQCEEYVRADINEKKIKNSTVQVEINQGCDSAPSEFLPTQEWQNFQTSEFSSFRLHLERVRSEIEVTASNFNGREEICLQKCSEEPKFSEVILYNQNAVTKLLEYHLQWLDKLKGGETFTRITGIWLYALLARLEIPLTPERCFLVRELARKCSRIRASLRNKSENEYLPLNLFISLIVNYFKQNDLVENS